MAGKGELSNGLTDAVVRVAAFMSSSPASTTQRLLHMQEHWVVETGPEETICFFLIETSDTLVSVH